MIIIKRTSGFRPYIVAGKEVQDIIIYGSGKILFQAHQGWFEAREKGDIIEFKLKNDFVRANKPSLDRKDNYYVTNHSEAYYSKGIALYIHESEIAVENRREHLAMQCKTERNYLTGADLTFHSEAITQGFHDTEIVKTVFVDERFYTRKELTEFGQRVADTEAEFKAAGIEVQGYYLQKILEQYDLVKRS